MGQLASQLFHGQVCVIPSLSQLQWADKRSRVHFKCAICIWNLLLSTVKMRSKELSLSVKQAIIRLKKQNKPIREIAKTLGVAKTTVWNILKKKERTGELSNTKRPGRPRKTTVVDDRRILSLVKKTPFTTVGQIKNTLQEVGVCSSSSSPLLSLVTSTSEISHQPVHTNIQYDNGVDRTGRQGIWRNIQHT